MIYDINYQGRKISDRYSVVAKFITVDFFHTKTCFYIRDNIKNKIFEPVVSGNDFEYLPMKLSYDISFDFIHLKHYKSHIKTIRNHIFSFESRTAYSVIESGKYDGNPFLAITSDDLSLIYFFDHDNVYGWADWSSSEKKYK